MAKDIIMGEYAAEFIYNNWQYCALHTGVAGLWKEKIILIE